MKTVERFFDGRDSFKSSIVEADKIMQHNAGMLRVVSVELCRVRGLLDDIGNFLGSDHVVALPDSAPAEIGTLDIVVAQGQRNANVCVL